MIDREIKWKSISYEEYKRELDKYEKKYDKIERFFFDCPVKREVKQEYIDSKLGIGKGIMAYIRFIEEEENFRNLQIDDYNYYKNNGMELTIMMGEKLLNGWNKLAKQFNFNK